MNLNLNKNIYFTLFFFQTFMYNTLSKHSVPNSKHFSIKTFLYTLDKCFYRFSGHLTLTFLPPRIKQNLNNFFLFF